MLSSWGVSLSFFVSEAIIVVPNGKCVYFTPSVNLVFCGLSGGNFIVAAAFAVLVYLSEIWITFRFVGSSLICDSERLVPRRFLLPLKIDHLLLSLCL